MDFTKPLSTISINGFPVSFRMVYLPNIGALWVPRGISRNEEAKCWRYYLMHEKGLFSGYEFDSADPIDSLKRAFDILTGELEGSTSRFSVDARRRPPGHARDPLIDTGFTGVSISRSVREGKKRVVIISHQMVRRPGGKVAAQGHYMGSISEDDLIRDPAGQENYFFDLLKDAVAIRRTYNRHRALGEYRQTTYRLDEVPEEIAEMPVSLPKLDLQAIMDSFMAVPSHRPPRTTGGDPDKLTERLKNLDLFMEQDPFHLEGRFVRFYKNVIKGRSVWLPKPLFQVYDHWRIKLPHEGGWVCVSIYDEDHGGDPFTSLIRAWTYLVDLYREYKGGDERSRKSLTEPLLCTGIPGVYIQSQKRISKKTGRDRWSFSVCLNQPISKESSRKTSIKRWFIEDLTDQDLHSALRKGEAMMNYRQHLIENGLSLDDACLNKETVVPSEFWKESLECPVYVEDLKYFIDRIKKEE